MKIAIITDTHYGCRKGSKLFHDYFEQFYRNVFFPTLEKHRVASVVHMGDAFDSRKSIDFQSLEWSKRVVFEPLSKYQTHMIVGNHDCYYKNTNDVNAISLLLKEFSNIITYDSPKTVNICGLETALIPWICAQNYEETLDVISKSKAKIAMGHLELNGFLAHKGHMMETGMDSNVFSKFKKVFSGHFHTISDNGHIFYLGNPYEIYWNDANDTRGFTIFDTETLEHTHIKNPYKMFHTVYYEDTKSKPYDYSNFDFSEYENKIVKIIVRKKNNIKKFEKFIDKFYSIGAYEIKIIENYEIVENEDYKIGEDENTLSILKRYVEESEVSLDKKYILDIFNSIYKEACEVY